MPLEALALVGFMDEGVAKGYFQERCAPPAPDYPTLLADWRKAKAKRGAPMPKAGHPDYRDIPPEYVAYMDEVKATPYYNTTVAAMSASFKMVEINPLLAFQFQVETEKATRVCDSLSKPPSMQEMLKLCLPLGTRDIEIHRWRQTETGIIVESKDSNFAPLRPDVGKVAGHNPHA